MAEFGRKVDAQPAGMTRVVVFPFHCIAQAILP